MSGGGSVAGPRSLAWEILDQSLPYPHCYRFLYIFLIFGMWKKRGKGSVKSTRLLIGV